MQKIKRCTINTGYIKRPVHGDEQIIENSKNTCRIWFVETSSHASTREMSDEDDAGRSESKLQDHCYNLSRA